MQSAGACNAWLSPLCCLPARKVLNQETRTENMKSSCFSISSHIPQLIRRALAPTRRYGSVPKGGRYIVILRDPMDVVISFYNFFAGWFFPCPGSDVRVSDDPMSAPVGVDDFIEHFFLRRGRPSSDMENAGLWEFILSWLPHVKGANRAAGNGSEDKKALIVFYEDMLKDHVGIIRKVARCVRDGTSRAVHMNSRIEHRSGRSECSRKEIMAQRMIRTHVNSFLDLGAGDEALTQKVATMSTFEFMKANEVKFDEHPCKEKRNAACGLLPTAGLKNSKVRGHVANRPQMSEATKSKLAERWRATIGAETGYSSYAELRAAYGSSGTL